MRTVSDCFRHPRWVIDGMGVDPEPRFTSYLFRVGVMADTKQVKTIGETPRGS